MQKRKIALVVEYDGTCYAGWQRQENAIAVQNVLEDALKAFFEEDIILWGSSRTDSGVHARNHVSHFMTSSTIPAERIPFALLAYLPDDIAIKYAAEVDEHFHARFSAIGKQYSYYIWNDVYRSALLHRYSYHEARALDLIAMQEACSYFIGEKDFKAFQASGSEQLQTVREIYSLSIDFEREGLLAMKINGNAFLYNMVRIIAGTLLYVGLGKIKARAIPGIIASLDRRKAGITLPANGLFLDKVSYPKVYNLSCYNNTSPNKDKLIK